ncbi:hypothetical protein K0M31_018933 [Melipona bicolor]|uniref:Uncharacterized protein n=1 Tax=Melipona bicolor TaxID=60889 RepID=A0AA40KS64_9HYME|nr:hypothetical protein K0M31_018933 [Melipona bicolor]
MELNGAVEMKRLLREGKVEAKFRWLSNNQIHTIERGAFQDLVGVEKLRLNNNQIRHLPDLLFSNMMNLKRL